MSKQDQPIKPSAVSKTRSASLDVQAFVEEARALPSAGPQAAIKGRIIFALDATLSRQPTWDIACQLQAEMFEAVRQIGGLEVQLTYFRGFGECKASRWASDAQVLKKLMTGIRCQGGQTQISKVLVNARCEQERGKVNALVFIGDAMEENADLLAQKAGELGLCGVPIFVFQEGRDKGVERVFRELARLSNGAYARFDQSSAAELAALLRAVAVFATGGLKALEASSDRLLLPQIKGR
ncbi:MAG: VWA domain-containing protein [Rhizobiales bacterium]|nr:VWA domain-containing protein [Hyphomicrobiales bacterium]